MGTCACQSLKSLKSARLARETQGVSDSISGRFDFSPFSWFPSMSSSSPSSSLAPRHDLVVMYCSTWKRILPDCLIDGIDVRLLSGLKDLWMTPKDQFICKLKHFNNFAKNINWPKKLREDHLFWRLTPVPSSISSSYYWNVDWKSKPVPPCHMIETEPAQRKCFLQSLSSDRGLWTSGCRIVSWKLKTVTLIKI